MKKLLSLYIEEDILTPFVDLTEQKLGIDKHKAAEFIISLLVKKTNGNDFNLWQKNLLRRLRNATTESSPQG